jgi:hypothetical protein
MSKPRITDEQFVKLWQTCLNTNELMEKTGMTRAGLKAKADYCRKHGVELKRYNAPTDWNKLKELAADPKAWEVR